MTTKKRILIIGHNFSPEPTGIGKYNGEMADWLATHGYDCTVVTTFPSYPHWKVQAPYKNGWYKKETYDYSDAGGKLTVYRCPAYVPQNPTGKKRMLHDFSFFFTKSILVLSKILFKKRFDITITVAPPFHLAFLARVYRKIRGGVLVYHIQDLQIDAAQKLKQLKGNTLFNLMYRAEKEMLKSSDFVSSISEGMIKKIKIKHKRDVLLFPNWVDTQQFYPIEDKAGLKEKWGLDPNKLICLYSGSIGEKQGLENVIHAAELLKDNSGIHFAICGSGPYKKRLEEMALSKSLGNISFFELQEKEKFNEFLNMADVHLIVQKAYVSDLVMPSKLFTILSIGGVGLVTTKENTSLYELVEGKNLGFTIEPDDHVKLANIIETLPGINMDAMRSNARAYALRYINIDNVMAQFLRDIEAEPVRATEPIDLPAMIETA